MAEDELDTSVKDLMDFFLRWPEFKDTAAEIATLPNLSNRQQVVIHWLIVLADRIGQADLSPGQPPPSEF